MRQRRLEEEIDAALDGRPPEYPISRICRITRMVIDEAMRLYPPAWGFSRQALADDELGGFHLPRGWLAFVIPYVLHRLPAFWQDPDAFDPERFSPERSADRPKFVYLPFGAGPRQCIGSHFALIEAQVSCCDTRADATVFTSSRGTGLSRGLSSRFVRGSACQ